MFIEGLLSTRIQRHADERPDERVLSFVDARLEIVESLTYRQLDHRARSVAASLLERGLGGAPVVLSFPPGLDFVSAFCGSLYAGAIAVPAALPQSRRTDERLAAILKDSGARCVLTSAAHRADLYSHAGSSGVLVDVIATELLPPLQDGGPVAATGSEQLAFLQYTSGSTRAPRGVMVRHGDLAANLNSLHEILGFDDDAVGVSWLPVFHDMGLIAGVLLPIWLGRPQYLMAPATFIRNPLSWLKAISRYGGTHQGAPNFGYQACVDAARATGADELDLTSWRVAWNGAEPVRPDTLDEFRDQFALNGFQPECISPGYGLAEATLVVSGSDGSKPATELIVDESELHIGQVRSRIDDGPGAKRLVGSGRPGAGIEVRIVRPDVCRTAEPHALGEIWVRSDSVAQGYWDKPLETAETFGAYLTTGEGPYLRTGDLGFLDDGELFVIGRLKDVIVIRGVNYYPHDLEYTVERSHPALQPDAGALVGVEHSGRVDLVAVCEIRRDCRESFAGDEVVDAIRRAVAREHQLALQRIVLLRPGGLPKTSSGKVQRAKCKDDLGGALLPVVHEWQISGTGTASIDFDIESLSQPGILERQLVDWLQQELSLGDLTWRTPLTELGIDSLKGVELVNVLSAAFNFTFPPTSMLDHPSVASLAGLIRDAKLGIDTGHGASSTGSDGAVYTEEQIDALDEMELVQLLQQRVEDVLDGGRP
jgi:acyl-CoA synthetase (AMP-forming)/AMP-acid ligase II/acyl carrier protein